METNRKVRSKKLNTKVDLTAMVSVSFLLIIFFMVTIELSKPKALDLNLPDNDWTCGRWHSCGGENRTVTILLGENNTLVSYMGFIENPIFPVRKTTYGKYGIRKELFLQNNKILAYSAQIGKPGKGINVIIKPSKNCNYGNLVDILDEMAIAKINTYVIQNEFSPEETNLLASN